MKAVLLTSSILIVLIAALRPLLRGKIDPRVQYALWLAVVLRLLIPVNVADSAYSALALLSRAGEPARIVESIGRIPIPAQSYDSAHQQALQEYEEQVERGELVPHISQAELVNNRTSELMRGPTVGELAEQYARPVWLGGGLVTALWFLLVNLRLRRKLRFALPVEADCPLPVRVTPELPSPCLCGAVRPAIYVTPAALEHPERLRHVLAHELTHYRHRDHWWALVRCLCLCVYWFDPLVWWAAALSRQDCELACDEGAIRRLGEAERIPYGRTLVDMIAAGRTSLLQTATTMTGGKKRVTERIRLIARRPKTVIAAALALAVVLALAVGCTFTGAPEGADGPGTSQPPEETALPGPTSVESRTDRLTQLPEDWDDVVVEPLEVVEDGSVLLALRYWLDVSEEERAVGAGCLADVYLWSRSQFQRAYFGGAENQTGMTCFAKTGDDFYFVLCHPTSAAYPRDAGPERYLELFDAVPEFVREVVLSTEGVEPFDPEDMAGPLRTIRAVVDEIADAPGTAFALYRPVDGLDARQYHTETPPNDYWGVRVREFIYDYVWEELTMEQAAALMAQGSGVSLMIAPSGVDSPACITVYQGCSLMAVRTLDNEMAYYKAGGENDDEELGHYWIWSGPYDILRWWYDEVEMDALRAPASFIPDQGQSHEEIARAWAEGYEGAMAKAAPGGSCACTYVQVRNVETGISYWPDLEAMSRVVGPKGLLVEEYGETWFTFTYQTVFVPENGNALMQLMAGNTEEYTGDDAPEGACTYGRVGYMILTDQGWTCLEPGCTGW